jgi:hypothetical protein
MKLTQKIISAMLTVVMIVGLLAVAPTEVKAQTIAEQATDTLAINEFDTITLGGSAIVYKVKIKQKGTLELKFSQTSLPRVAYEWYNEEGEFLTSKETYYGSYSSIEFSDLTEGTYYFRVWGLNENYYGDYTYFGNFTADESASLELGISLVKGKSVQLAGMFENCTDKSLTWKSSNKKVATVNKNGKVTAKKKGTVTIKAYNKSGLVAKIKVKVTNK